MTRATKAEIYKATEIFEQYLSRMPELTIDNKRAADLGMTVDNPRSHIRSAFYNLIEEIKEESKTDDDDTVTVKSLFNRMFDSEKIKEEKSPEHFECILVGITQAGFLVVDEAHSWSEDKGIRFLETIWEQDDANGTHYEIEAQLVIKITNGVKQVLL